MLLKSFRSCSRNFIALIDREMNVFYHVSFSFHFPCRWDSNVPNHVSVNITRWMYMMEIFN